MKNIYINLHLKTGLCCSKVAVCGCAESVSTHGPAAAASGQPSPGYPVTEPPWPRARAWVTSSG